MSIELRINGERYDHWEKATVQRSMLQAAGQLNLTYSASRKAIKPGVAFDLLLDGHQAMRGYLDSVSQRLSHGELNCTAQGRDKTADLVDCSNHDNGKTGSLAQLPLDELVLHYCAPYGIQLIRNKNIELGEKLSLGQSPGETAWAAIERACRQRAVLATSDAFGNLLLTRAGADQHPAALVEGQNIISAELNLDHSQRYYRYLWLLQSSDAAQWSPSESTVLDSDVKEVIDDDARAPRTLVGVIDSDGGDTYIDEQVNWECNVRRGRSQMLDVEVAGFSLHGHILSPNQLIHCRLPSFGISQQWLIVSTLQTYDQRGSITKMQLMPPSAFSLLAEQVDSKKQWMEGKL